MIDPQRARQSSTRAIFGWTYATHLILSLARALLGGRGTLEIFDLLGPAFSAGILTGIWCVWGRRRGESRDRPASAAPGSQGAQSEEPRPDRLGPADTMP